jgi:hypothetical protein
VDDKSLKSIWTSLSPPKYLERCYIWSFLINLVRREKLLAEGKFCIRFISSYVRLITIHLELLFLFINFQTKLWNKYETPYVSWYSKRLWWSPIHFYSTVTWGTLHSPLLNGAIHRTLKSSGDVSIRNVTSKWEKLLWPQYCLQSDAKVKPQYGE